MRVLLDECVPRPLKREFPGHDVNTVVEMGWGSKRNSALLAPPSSLKSRRQDAKAAKNNKLVRKSN